MPKRTPSIAPRAARRGLPLGPIIALGVVLLAAIVVVVLIATMGRETIATQFDQVDIAMPRSQVEQLLGAATKTDRRVEHIGPIATQVDILEWDIPRERQVIRIEFVDDKVVIKNMGRR